MRWLKHLSCAHEDELMAELIEEFGPEGYGVWWIILERIAASMGESEKTSLRYSARNWASSCRISENRFIEIVTYLSENHPTFRAKITEKHVTIECPNLLKYRDEYSRRNKKIVSGQSPDKLRTMSGECPDTVPSNLGGVSGRDRDREESGESPDTDGEQSRTKKSSCSPKVNECVSPSTMFTAYADKGPPPSAPAQSESKSPPNSPPKDSFRPEPAKSGFAMAESDPDFECFWQNYPVRGVPPRKQGKAKTLKVWNRLSKKRELPDLDDLLRLLDKDKESRQWKDPQYIPMAATWLNSKPWQDNAIDGEERPGSGSVLLDMYYRGEL